ncbi:hypothetical protein [Mycobacterium sp.]|uniref:hypothetical protein n=1 Tax=Mycobacterium sp. TaxID=1785 RepID=UPI002D830053|nr:hypothetical protein [Mycobacterium sp.]
MNPRRQDGGHPIDYRVLGVTTWADHLNPQSSGLDTAAPGGGGGSCGGCGGCGGCSSASR